MALALTITGQVTLWNTTVTINIDPGGVTLKGILVAVTQAGATLGTMTVTYGGVSVPEITGSPQTKATGEANIVRAFFLGASIPTGAQDCVVNSSSPQNCSTIVYGLSGVTGNMEVIDTEFISSDSLANPTSTLSLGGRTAFCVILFGSGQDAAAGATPTAGWTARFERDYGTMLGCCYSYDTISTADVAAGWTQTAEDANAIAVAVGEVAGGGGGAARRRRIICGS